MFRVLLDSNGNVLLTAQNTTEQATTGANNISNSVWTHVAAVYASATDRKLYVNGVFDSDSNTNSVTFPACDKVGFGVRLTTSKIFYDGKLSDVRIWNTARTAQQIADNYNKRLIGNESGLVGYWKLDKGSGTTVADSTTNANAGTITGAIWDNSEPFTEPIDDGTAVRTWSDQSGNGYDATQSTTAARPTYIASGLNGLPVVRFDGTDDVMSIPSSTATFKFLHSDVSTIFIVAKAGIVTDPNTRYGFLGTNGGGNTSVVGININWDDRASQSLNNAIRTGITNGTGWRTLNTENNYFAANTFGILTVRSDPANATPLERSILNFNGGTDRKNNVENSTLSTANSAQDVAIGSGGASAFLLNGDIAEIIVYNRALNTSELSQVHRYLARKWGIALA
jgi:hypothetical protein